MTINKYDKEEDRPLLVLALDFENLQTPQPVYKAAVTRGAINYLKQWPAHILAAFVAGFLVISTFILFGILTTILTISNGENCRIPRNIEADYIPNIYFVKHENQTWNKDEFCYIETTSKMYKNLSIYLINLLDDNYLKNDHINNSLRIIEKEVRNKLSIFNENIKNIDVTIGDFFNRSRLKEISNHLNENLVVTAAKIYVLWNFPGVALDPKMYQNLKTLNEYLNRDIKDEIQCGKKNTATLDRDGYIQASNVPCEAFLDYLIQEISINEFSNWQSTLEKAINNYCERSFKCQDVKILRTNDIPKTVINEETLNCPTIIINKMKSKI